jgi:hypothetical protein
MKRRTSLAYQLNALLALRKKDPAQFARTGLGRPETLRRLLRSADAHIDYERVIGSNRTPAAQARRVMQCLVVSELVKAIKTGDSARFLAQGLYLFWHQALDPVVDYSHKLPSLDEVVAYCVEQENYYAFIREAKAILQTAYEGNEAKHRELIGLFDDGSTMVFLISGLEPPPKGKAGEQQSPRSSGKMLQRCLTS